ncbi:MAG: extracellular solute-binding protein [Caldilinea sp. CFX5]|nr:extracellular solute-binding protein [Caldilinea sp. CFX5]
MLSHHLSRRDFLKRVGVTTVGVALVAGCAPGVAPGGQAGGSAAAEAKKIVWYMNIDETRNTWAEQTIMPAFQEEHPDIQLELMTVPWEEHDTKLFAMNAAGDSADLFAQWGQSGGGTYYHKGILLDITDFAADWDLSNIPESLQNYYKFDGKLFGVPMYSLGSFIYYNKDLFDAAGVAYPPLDWNDESWTWDEMVSRAQKLTKDVDDPAKAQYGIRINLNDLYVGVPWLFGADPFPPEAYESGKVTAVNMDSEEMIAALQAKADLTYKHGVAPNPAASEALSAQGNVIGTGKVAMIYQGGWGIWELNGLEGVNWGVGAVPRQTSNKIPTFSDPWYITKASKEPASAFELVKYLTTGPGQKSIALDLAAPPADQTLLSEWYKNFTTVDAADLEQVYKGAIERAQETPASLLFGYIQVEDVYNQVTAPLWNGEKSAAEVLPEVDKAAEEALQTLG